MRAHKFIIKTRLEYIMDKKVRRMQAKIRKMTWYQKLILRDWINNWYSDYIEQERLDYEQWARDEE